MILVVDLGNTNIVFGLFNGKKLASEWRFSTAKLKIPKINHKISAVIIASVVPALNKIIQKKLKKLYKCKVHFVTAQNIKGIKVMLKNKQEIGADRVADALAAYRLYGGPTIIVDFGTATTFDLISNEGEYLGGAIAPGIDLARDALYEHAAKLPKIKISAPKGVVGKNTKSAMQSGLVYGYAAMVDGMIKKIASHISRPASRVKVIATGGLAPLICKYTTVVDTIDKKLTLKGLQMIGKKLNG
ncbi:MAG: type III pantothenate kinase [Candidatus Margulisiibacteriota bacterium]|nr:type III pantothenate kinase [Candidatus Margulisiibacteriota bacterium]